jgi:protein AFG1
LRKLYDELKDYSPPLDLLRRLSPDAPVLARRMRENAGKDSWWNKLGKSKGQPETKDERERALVRVLSGEEELAELDVPKVSHCHTTSILEPV